MLFESENVLCIVVIGVAILSHCVKSSCSCSTTQFVRMCSVLKACQVTNALNNDNNIVMLLSILEKS